jgi:hypothetical protein
MRDQSETKNILAEKTTKVPFGVLSVKIFVDSDFAVINFGSSHILWEVRVSRFLV